ncbi:MAG: GTP-binding protein [Candidatus Lokiarchaeota archaeon]|nr:GTP-binding protein [Candidatus Lokiarchaeota archaeon]
MLRKVYILNMDKVVYKRDFGKGLSEQEFNTIVPDIIREAFSKRGKEIGVYDYFKYKISYIIDKSTNYTFMFISGLSDDFERLQTELIRFKNEFISMFGEVMNEELDNSILEIINPVIDNIHRNLKPKISLVGFSGVGKTTITKLIRAEEIPLEHIPTITGDVATIKIGKLSFYLWDFAGQDQFSFLWNKFIKGSDAVLLITDSTLKNIEKTKYFLELIKEEAPYAHSAVIGNKQDLPEAVSVERIEQMLGVKTYSMIAIETGNRKKMIQIIADILDISADISPLLKPLIERDNLMNQAQIALESGDFLGAAHFFEEIAEKCLEIGDYSLSIDFYNKCEKLKEISIQQ